MVITVECPSCASSFPVDSAKIPERGVPVRCSSCATVFRVEPPVDVGALAPSPAAEPVPPPSVPEPEAAEPELPSDWVIEGSGVDAAEEPAAPDAAGATMFAAEDLSGSEEPTIELEAPEPEVAVEEAPAVEAPAPEATLAPPEVPTVEPAVEAPAAEASEEEAPSAPVKGFTFGKRDPSEKARRLARVLVSDMIMYNPERHEKALAEGSLKEDFEDEIEKSWKEYVEQVGEEMAEGPGRGFWADALNDVLAKGQQIF